MDPLGARSDIIRVEELTRWNLTQLPEYSEEEKRDDEKKSPFPWRNDLNAKIVLWSGDITELNAHAITNTSNERFTDRSLESQRIFAKAGPDLEEEIARDVRICRTGEAKLSKGHNLPVRFIIHSVGPRYNVKYITAAESALHNCYRNVLHLARENGVRTLGLGCLHSARRGYPPEDAAHIAIRTVRRFLEKFGDAMDTIVFVCSDEVQDFYRKLLPLYFPRNLREEQVAVDLLPSDVGNEDGEPIIQERQIRIMDKPTFAAFKKSGVDDFEETIDLNQEFATSTVLEVGHHPFAMMEENPDTAKRSMLMERSRAELEEAALARRYDQFVKRSMTADLTDVAGLRCLYRSGVDRRGRPVIVFVGKNFLVDAVDLEKALLYLVRVMDSVVERDYVVVYFHTQTSKANHPPMDYLKTAYSFLPHKYKKNLRAFYIVHPTWWSKLATWFFTTFTASSIKKKVQSLGGVQYLYTRINPDQLDVPVFVTDHDIEVNGIRYAVPDEPESTDGL